MAKISTKNLTLQSSGLPEFLKYRTLTKEVKMEVFEGIPEHEVLNNENIVALVRDCYIRDNLDSTILGDDKDASISISFEFKTGGETINSTLGSFSHVRDKTPVQIKDMVVLPLHRVSDYFTLTVNMIEEREIVKLQDKISKTLTFAGHVVNNIPNVGAVGSTLTGLVGEFINLMCALSPEKVLLRDTATFIVDKQRYPDLKDIHYLNTGFLLVYEKDYTYRNGKFYNKENLEEKPTMVVLQILKPKSKIAS